MSINYHDMVEANIGQRITCEEARQAFNQGMFNIFTGTNEEFEEVMLRAFAEPVNDRYCTCYLSKIVF